MNWWPFSKPEKRASYSEALSGLLFTLATGKHPVPHLTAAAESACGFLGRGLEHRQSQWSPNGSPDTSSGSNLCRKAS